MTMLDSVKKSFSVLLPRKLQTALKKRYYLRIVRNVSESAEAYFPVIRYLAAPGDHVADIGANIGTYTKFLSDRVGTGGKVYSAEPVPETCDVLRYCVKMLGLRNVDVSQCAVSDEDGSVTMRIPKYQSGVENCYRAHIAEKGDAAVLRSVTAIARTIDSLFSADAGPVSFMKIDVEGHELAVIRGGLATFRQFHPVLLVEISQDPDDSGSDSFKLFELLRQLDYRPCCMEGPLVRLRRSGDHRVDYFFLTDAHVESLRQCGIFADSAPGAGASRPS
jgi:FkbM family methyltransferase